MRFKSKKVAGSQIFAVAGVNTVSFAIVASPALKKGLLGFAVERSCPAENERFFMLGFKVFRELIPQPDEKTQVSTHDHPIQSFSWDDFTAKPKHDYEYFFHPIKGKPKNLDRSAKAISIKVKTEPLFSTAEHDIFFNRGVASSQAYRRRFENKPPDKLKPPSKQVEALQWLSRELDDAILEFIKNTNNGDTLLCCFYEFRHQPVADALRAAQKKGVTLKLIIDAKVNEHTDSKGKFHESFPRIANLETIKKAGITKSSVIKREARRSAIQHNKFMVRLKGAQAKPTEVWTGSTNISLGGITGQTNVGHWVRNSTIAAEFKAYWDLLASDPGGKAGDAMALAKKKNAQLRKDVAALKPVPTTIAGIPQGVTTIFSPRSGDDVLNLYVNLLDKADHAATITLAFGINKAFKDQLKDNNANSHIVFLLLEKKDKPTKKNVDTFVAINAKNNVYKAWGAFIRDPVYQWARETNAQKLGLNQHVSYIHSKFLLKDPLSADPIVVSGSANFSGASTNENDENMLVIRGDQRVADIYFTEFNRLFYHYYFRAVVEELTGAGKTPDDDSLFLVASKTWLKKYAPGKLKAKRLKMYAEMDGAVTL